MNNSNVTTGSAVSEDKRQELIITQLVKRLREETGLRFCSEDNNNGRWAIGLMSTKLGMQILAYRVSFDGAFTALQSMQKLLRVQRGQKVPISEFLRE